MHPATLFAGSENALNSLTWASAVARSTSCARCSRTSPSARSPRSPTTCPATPTRSAGPWGRPSAWPSSSRSAASSRWPRAPAGSRRRPHRPGRRRRLPARPGRGAQRPLGRRPALGVPDRRAGGVARDVRHRGAQRGRRRHPGPVRRAGLRLHRRAVGLQRRRAQRRARDHRPGPAATARAAGGAAPRRLARGGRRSAAERAEWTAAEDPDGGRSSPSSQVRAVLAASPPRPCRRPRHRIGTEGMALLLVPDVHGRRRSTLLQTPRRPRRGGRPGPSVAGGAVSPTTGPRGYGASGLGPDSEQHLAELVLSADAAALRDLRERVLAPLEEHGRHERREADRDAALLAAAPRPPRGGGRRAVRAPPDRALPHGPAARALRRPPGGSADASSS